VVDNEIVDGISTDVETWDSIERGSIEAHAKTSERFAYKELRDDDR